MIPRNGFDGVHATVICWHQVSCNYLNFIMQLINAIWSGLVEDSHSSDRFRGSLHSRQLARMMMVSTMIEDVSFGRSPKPTLEIINR